MEKTRFPSNSDSQGLGEDRNCVVAQMVAHDPALADTRAILLNEEAMQIIMQGEQEWLDGKRIPLAEALL